MSIQYKTDDQIKKMAVAGGVVYDALNAVRKALTPGITTADLNEIAAQVIAEAGAIPSFKGYGFPPFPGVICASVNEEVVHGIPGTRRLEAGDVVSIDCGAIVDGWHGDSAITAIVGPGDPADEHLSSLTEGAMWAGIAAFASSTHLGAVGNGIEDYVRRDRKPLQIVREYVGHGIGTEMHQDPQVLHYRTRERGPRLRPGLVVAIEPQLVRGSRKLRLAADEWTVVTCDGSRAAHWEHSVALHKDGVWVTTAPDGGKAGLAPFGITPVPVS